jgi:hypothetical protein
MKLLEDLEKLSSASLVDYSVLRAPEGYLPILQHLEFVRVFDAGVKKDWVK